MMPSYDVGVMDVFDEYLVFDLGDKCIVVNITLPASDTYGEEFDWSQLWLGGLRINSGS